jgi:hypothetical protein
VIFYGGAAAAFFSSGYFTPKTELNDISVLKEGSGRSSSYFFVTSMLLAGTVALGIFPVGGLIVLSVEVILFLSINGLSDCSILDTAPPFYGGYMVKLAILNPYGLVIVLNCGPFTFDARPYFPITEFSVFLPTGVLRNVRG